VDEQAWKIDLKLPVEYWIDRWDRMQEFYLPDRKVRFETLISLVRAGNPEPRRLLDIGCGTGSIMQECLEAFPSARVVGVDYDPTLLFLANERLTDYRTRVELLQADVRLNDWTQRLSGGFDAVLSATALHWLSAQETSLLYTRVFAQLESGGVFLNADHAASPNAGVQKYWRSRMRAHRSGPEGGKEPWETFWEDYLMELGGDAAARWKSLQASRHGVEGGMPLDWHFDRLKEAGFVEVDCFYRYYGDAVYGGVKSGA
jgi:SAM-dependent methyltransferase